MQNGFVQDILLKCLNFSNSKRGSHFQDGYHVYKMETILKSAVKFSLVSTFPILFDALPKKAKMPY